MAYHEITIVNRGTNPLCLRSIHPKWADTIMELELPLGETRCAAALLNTILAANMECVMLFVGQCVWIGRDPEDLAPLRSMPHFPDRESYDRWLPEITPVALPGVARALRNYSF
jgi:hypothetical protein